MAKETTTPVTSHAPTSTAPLGLSAKGDEGKTKEEIKEDTKHEKELKHKQAEVDKLAAKTSGLLNQLAEATEEHNKALAEQAALGHAEAHRRLCVAKGLPEDTPVPTVLPTRHEAAMRWMEDAAKRLGEKTLNDPDLAGTTGRISEWMRSGHGGDKLATADELHRFMAAVGL